MKILRNLNKLLKLISEFGRVVKIRAIQICTIEIYIRTIYIIYIYINNSLIETLKMILSYEKMFKHLLIIILRYHFSPMRVTTI